MDEIKNKPKEPIELFGYECEDGWLPLINEAKEFIDDYNAKNNLEGEDACKFLQVKEKFGTLTIYCNFYFDGLHEKLAEIERKSSTICEICGNNETAKTKPVHGWIMTLCDECREKEEERYRKIFEK